MDIAIPAALQAAHAQAAINTLEYAPAVQLSSHLILSTTSVSLAQSLIA